MKLKLATTHAELWHRLLEPFKPSRVQWRVDNVSAKGRVMLLCYVDARTVAARLDRVVSPAGWRVRYEPWDGGVLCTLGIRCPETGDWIEKQGVGTGNQFEKVKGAASDAFKRAAVQWGVGRYLYSVPEAWVGTSDQGTIWVKELKAKVSPPAMPKWATPEGWPALDQGGE